MNRRNFECAFTCTVRQQIRARRACCRRSAIGAVQRIKLHDTYRISLMSSTQEEEEEEEANYMRIRCQCENPPSQLV